MDNNLDVSVSDGSNINYLQDSKTFREREKTLIDLQRRYQRQEVEDLREEVDQLENEKKNLREEVDQLETEKKIDNLTGLYNREGVYEHVKKQINKAHDYSQKFSVFFMDLDNFKEVNDSLNHEEGDEYLLGIAEAMDSITRDGDNIISRYGGDEFVAVFSDVSEDGAESIAERLNEKVDEYIEDHFRDHSRNIEELSGEQGISIGFAVYTPDELDKHSDNPDESDKYSDPREADTQEERLRLYRLQFKRLVDEADDHMYEIKHNKQA